jgi:SAM-dependent methyltransferase
MSAVVFARAPLSVREGIPVFSDPDEYTDNYERIAADHVASLRMDGVNPFIPEELWVEFEGSTHDIIQRYAMSCNTVLDVGVGLGRLLSPFSALQRYGIDISWTYLEIARSKGIEVCYARIEHMPYCDEMFDLVVCTDVLEHVLDLHLCCRKILSVLKPGGVLIVRVPYRENLEGYLAPEYPYAYVHLRSFDEHQLRLLFERVFKCEVVEMRTVGHTTNRGRLIYPLNYRLIKYGVMPLLRMLQGIRSKWHARLLCMLYHAFEINVVIRKPCRVDTQPR